MVAANIHGFACAAHGTTALPDRRTASSQGILIEAMDASERGFGAEDRQR